MKVNISNTTKRMLIMAGIIGPIFFFTILSILGLLWSGYNSVQFNSPFKY